MTKFITLPVFYHTGESSRKGEMSKDLGIEIEASIDDYEIRPTRVNVEQISYYSSMDFMGMNACGMDVCGVEITVGTTCQRIDELIARAVKPSAVVKRRRWSSVIGGLIGLATKIPTKLTTKTVLIFVLASGLLFSQGDCPAVCVSDGGSYTAVAGSVNEFTLANRGCLTAGEATSSYWLRINFTSNGVFMMTITPSGKKNDFDFAIWSGASCPPTTPPVRCSWAGVFPFGGAVDGFTGLAAGNVDVSETAAGDGWLAPMNVVNGQSILININNYGNGSNDFTTSYTGTTASMFCGVVLGDDLRMSVKSSLCGYDLSYPDRTYVEVSYDLNNFETVDGYRLETSEQSAYFRLMSVNVDGETVAVDYAYCKMDCNVFVVSVTDLQGRTVDRFYVGVKVVLYSDGTVRFVM